MTPTCTAGMSSRPSTDMAALVYTDQVSGNKETLNVDTIKAARNLFRYAVSVATAFVLIELVDGGEVVKSHLVPDDIA